MSKRTPIGPKYLEKPIIQGGTGVGVSLGDLAGIAMKGDGMGVISAAHPGYRKENFWKDPLTYNIKAVYEEAAKARVISEDRDLLGVNVMVASHHHGDYVKVAIGANVGVTISSVGILMSSSSAEDSNQVVLVPIASSGRAARLILKSWDRHCHCCPDLIAMEGSLAGGHLSFKREELLSSKVKEFSELVREVLQEIQTYGELYQASIPVFTVGGVYTREDIAASSNIGVGGIRMATRFIIVTECGAGLAFKQKIADVRKEDIILMANPTGFLGCATMTALMRNTLKDRIALKYCTGCMEPCVPVSTPYRVSDALVHPMRGDVENDLVFTGVNT